MLNIVRTVDSTNIDCFAWYEGTLFIQFKKHGDVYAYLDVQERMFHEFREAPSLGKFFHANIKPIGGVKMEANEAANLGFVLSIEQRVAVT